MVKKRLSELAKVIRSKNAGVDHVTCDIIFGDRASYELVKDSGVLSRGAIARIYGVPESRISGLVVVDATYTIKFNLRRERPAGSAGDSDVYGSQWYVPVLDVEVLADN